MEEVRKIIKEELIVLFEANRTPPSYIVVDGNDCLPKNEVTPYQVLKKRESKCQSELSYLDSLQMKVADILVSEHIPADNRIAMALELIYKSI